MYILEEVFNMTCAVLAYDATANKYFSGSLYATTLNDTPIRPISITTINNQIYTHSPDLLGNLTQRKFYNNAWGPAWYFFFH